MDSSTCQHIWTTLLLFLTMVPTCSTSVCYGVRGETECMYDCHCSYDNYYRCQKTTGVCLNDCASSWFGPACQYAKLNLSLAEGSRGYDWAIDEDELTCNIVEPRTTQVTVALGTPYRLTWLRLVFSSSAVSYNGQISLGYKTVGTSDIKQCNDQQSSVVGPRSLDISCPTADRVTQVQVSGPGIKNLCSLYISAGRNVALKQNAAQSSTFVSGNFFTFNTWDAGKAVDGFREFDDGKQASDTCSHTLSKSTGFWKLTFIRPVDIYSVVLNNRVGFENRLIRFTLNLANEDVESIYNYTDRRTSGQKEYTITPPSRPNGDVYFLSVQQGNGSEILTLCEVIAYGETACPDDMYGRECENRCNCFNQTGCFVHSGGCPFGCAPGFYGEDCKTECRDGSFGFACNQSCSDHCNGLDISCDHIDGACTNGCEVGYLPPLCADECPTGKFGQDCNQNCSIHCEGEGHPCNAKDGSCNLGCEPGYLAPMCVDECQMGQFGLDCKENCSVHCKGDGKQCLHTNGACEQGCEPGYLPPQCLDECPPHLYGLSCLKRCSPGCRNDTCHHQLGRCSACQTGYYGFYCDLVCRSRTYGDGCNRTCDANCLNLLCNHVTGICNECVKGKSGDFCQKVIAQGGSSENGVDLGFLASLAVLIILIIIAIFVAVYIVRSIISLRKRREVSANPREAEGIEMELGGLENNSILQRFMGQRFSKGQIHAREEDDHSEHTYANMAKSSVVKVEDLKSYIEQHANDHLMKHQFRSVPWASKYSRLNAVDAANVKKNMYKNILPDDYTRVCLKVYNHYEDYINANHIKDYHEKRNFIAAQAPKENTQDDFVRMLWEQEVNRIVMLTNLVEGKKVKSVKYWSDDEPLAFDKITVKLANTTVLAEYTVRHLTLFKSGSLTRDLIQFHFTAWPDKSIPDSPWGLVELYQNVMADPGSGPLLVHCSAGVGRTGTFIGLCILMQEAEATGNMDFLRTLRKMRQERMYMIQTEEQYEFLHRLALTTYLVSGTSFLPKDLDHKLHAFEEADSASPTSGYSKEFEAVCKSCFHTTEDSHVENDESHNVYQNTKAATVKSKNRVKNILPNDAYRPVLACENKSLGKYINAVLVPNLTSTRHDIMTQLPLPSTVTDFWRLVTQYNVGLIVAFEADSWKSDETVGKFFPGEEAEPIKANLFEIQAKLAAESSGCHEILITVFKKRKSMMGGIGEHRVTCLLCKPIDTDSSTAIKIHKKMKYWENNAHQRTLFMCRNGADHSGLMCVQSILLDRLETDQRMSVPAMVGAIKAIRPQVIPNLDQYKHLYAILKAAQDCRIAAQKFNSIDATDSSDTQYCNAKALNRGKKSDPERSLVQADNTSEGKKAPTSPQYLNHNALSALVSAENENMSKSTQLTEDDQENIKVEKDNPPVSPIYQNQESFAQTLITNTSFSKN